MMSLCLCFKLCVFLIWYTFCLSYTRYTFWSLQILSRLTTINQEIFRNNFRFLVKYGPLFPPNQIDYLEGPGSIYSLRRHDDDVVVRDGWTQNRAAAIKQTRRSSQGGSGVRPVR